MISDNDAIPHFNAIISDIKKIDFGYEEKLDGESIKKLSEIESKFYKSYFHTENHHKIQIGVDTYVLIKGWGTKQIHQLSQILKGKLSTPVKYTPPTSGTNI